MKRKFLAFILICLTLLGSMFVAYSNEDEHADNPFSDYHYAQVKTTSGPLKLRKTASQRSATLLQINNRQTVLVIARGDEWTKVRYHNKQGFVMTKFLAFYEELPFETIDKNDQKQDIVTLKKRLRSLGYIDSSEVITKRYDRTMQKAIRRFLTVNGLKEMENLSPGLQAFILWGPAHKNTAERTGGGRTGTATDSKSGLKASITCTTVNVYAQTLRYSTKINGGHPPYTTKVVAYSQDGSRIYELPNSTFTFNWDIFVGYGLDFLIVLVVTDSDGNTVTASTY